MRDINPFIIMLRGAGDLASGAALRLYGAGLRRIIFLETPTPMAVRRTVSFSEAIYEGECRVEDVRAVRLKQKYLEHGNFLRAACESVWQRHALPVLADPEGRSVALLRPDVLIEATLAKRNVGVTLTDAPLVIGVGPGFTVGSDVHRAVESQRGISMGRLIRHGSALPNTGLPENVMGHYADRVLRAPADGIFETALNIGAYVRAGERIATVTGDAPDTRIGLAVTAMFDGRIRGLLRPGLAVTKGTKLGDVDPRPDTDIHRVSDKSLAIGGALLEAILEYSLQGDTY